MNAMKGHASARAGRVSSPFVFGVAFLAIVVIVLMLAVFKPSIQTILRSGETVTAEFDRNYQLRADVTRVKIGGLEVGVVSDIEETDKGTVEVSMKVEESALDTLGSEPSAVITPVTVLGGGYAIALKRGGAGDFNNEGIPQERTQIPVELDRVLETLPRPTRQSLQNTVEQLDTTLAGGGTESLQSLLAESPNTLRPAGEVLEAAQGDRPGVDLPQIVTNFHAMADVLTERQGQLGDIVTSLNDTTAVLAEQSHPLAEGIKSLPATLRSTRSGVIALRGSLDRLTTTAKEFRPAARELDSLLRELDPVLAEARPLMRDLRPLMRDARPLVEQLVPVASQGTETLENVRGPVMERVNGPISDTVMNTWRGSGPYKNSGAGMQSGHKFYEEVGYLAANMDRGSMTQDSQGSLLSFQVGAGTGSLDGVPQTPQNLLDQIEQYAGGGR
ncbi:phospholipid/cholesterol/gamma-HCH transport system substrate-binding protein [Haloechinothrix alba]|uniref:Phospholipid/cholesterol/gamma-HCH transport system substrate-binding protein n=1 Tax=Haloechinothrix alba TaxID=664784 RepID=A0A239AAH4_9PSEU|nr:MlaD family protein [Haloechinothrix alba]SNR92331.1 phospholipid/cholesterol/gamma-HCH transport system substrate-binding protein [Haloechinothrix alba]